MTQLTFDEAQREAIRTKAEGKIVGTVPAIIGVYINCPGERKEFIRLWVKEILELSRRHGLDIGNPDFILLFVSLEACGGHATYRTADDFPLVDVPCPCGNPNHWLVRWSEFSR